MPYRDYPQDLPGGATGPSRSTYSAGEQLVVKISQPRYRSLSLKDGETVFVTPGEMEFFRNNNSVPGKLIPRLQEFLPPCGRSICWTCLRESCASNSLHRD